MRVNVHGGGNIAMTQPHLNFFHADTISVEQAGAAMAKIVEANLSQVIFFEHLRKMLRNVSRLNQLSQLIHIDVLGILFTVASSA